MMGSPMLAYTIERARYSTHRESPQHPPIQTLRLDFENGETCHVMNGAWTADNPALALMAYCGAAPSRLDEMEGERLPVVVDGDGNVLPHEYAMRRGQKLLDDAVWFVPEGGDGTAVETEVPNQDSGGGGDPAA